MPRHVVAAPALLAAACAALAVLSPAALEAQASLAVHAARGPDTGAPWLVGATLGAGTHGIGLRAGAAISSLDRLLDADDDEPDPLWVMDADVVLGGQGGRGAHPYFLLGAGLQPSHAIDLDGDPLAHWSWGGGIAIRLGETASVFGEARRRTLFDRQRRSAIYEGSRASEVRGGVTLHFGEARDRDRDRDHDRRCTRRRCGRHD